MTIRNTARNLTLAVTTLLAGFALAPLAQASTMGGMHEGQMEQSMGTKEKGKAMMHDARGTGAHSGKMGSMHATDTMHSKSAMQPKDLMKMKSHAGMDSMATKMPMDHNNGM